MGIAGSSDLDLGNLEELPKLSTSLIAGSLQNLQHNDENSGSSDSGSDSGSSSGSSFMGFAGSNDLDFGKLGEELPESDSSFLLGSLQNFHSNENKRSESGDGSGDGSTSGSSFMGFAGTDDLDFGNAEELPENESSFLLGSLQNFNKGDDQKDDN
ncbi:uncharacterized protein DSM5745_08096 [Aspergillus mulundensis]|uniref:Uncharacterized protein n=1 Tax=Aspergillus mulundensis TaxID=1810919 RepID=A0A3D8R981_9EURO|nr:Uncharacterized protein DSM5745_08096 [Aspergillus mulundensis]RDW70585.1 Uncharacterized protein DSM5745_08096 [Aspergillus mulundensis]